MAGKAERMGTLKVPVSDMNRCRTLADRETYNVKYQAVGRLAMKLGLICLENGRNTELEVRKMTRIRRS